MLCEQQHATTQHVTACIPTPPFHCADFYKHYHTSGRSMMSAVTYIQIQDFHTKNSLGELGQPGEVLVVKV